MGTGWAIVATLIAGILVWGGAGLLLDRVLGSRSVFTAIGIIAGAGLSIYLVYLRYGRGDGGKT